MKHSIQYWVAGLLLLSSVMLSILVPGGPIETRGFSHIHPLLLGGFNIFLTTLSMASLALIYFVWKRQPWALFSSAVCGVSYFLVYVLDLARIFPVSPKGNTLVIDNSSSAIWCRAKVVLTAALSLLFGMGVVIFATRSAMGLT